MSKNRRPVKETHAGNNPSMTDSGESLTENTLSLTEDLSSNTSVTQVDVEGITPSKTRKIPRKSGRPPRETSAPVTWSIRGVERDTRAVIEKAAEKAGKTIGQYISDDVRGFAQSQLKESRLPASPKDLQYQVDHLTNMVEGIAARLSEPEKKSFWKRLFG